MGGRGASSNISNNISKSLDKIRALKKENLIVFDKNGKIIYTELGNNKHVGYENINYKDKIVAHNHPEGVYPYPSQKDFETMEKSGMAQMIVVSQNYSYHYEINKKYKGYGRVGLSYLMNQNNRRLSEGRKKINQQTFEKAKKGGYKNNQEYKQDTIKKQTQYMNRELKKLAKNSGYNLKITKKITN